MSFTDTLSLLGGVGIFLYGMKNMSEGLENMAEERLKSVLNKVTKNKLYALIIGIVSTAAIQSSSATTATVVSLVNAGLIDLSRATAIILGTDIGTTVTSLLISLNLKDFAPPAVLIGVLMIMFSSKDNHKFIGQAITGFGLLFMGINHMSDTMASLKDSPAFLNFIQGNSNPLSCVFIGFAITAIIQSSSASVGILQALSMQSLVPFELSAFIVLGQNLGEVVPTLLSSVGAKTDARRAAFFRFLFSLITIAVFFFITLLTPYAKFVESLTDNPTLQISLLHVFFNIGATAMIYPINDKVVALTKILIRDKSVSPIKIKS